MLAQLSRNWWTFLLRGICAVIFGLLIITWPASLVLLFGLFALTDGILALVAAIFGYGYHNRSTPTWWLVTMGIASVIVGLYAVREPVATGLVLILLVASWLLISGVFALFGALGLPKGTRGKTIFIMNALLSLAFGIVIFCWPVAGAVSIMWIIAFYAIFIGISLVGFSLQVRKLVKQAGETN